jgi:predicted nucleotidyltransferase
MDFAHPVESVIPGATGRLLAVLAETSAELNLRTLAGLARVSIAQASRVLPHLVEIGLVERRDVPPSALFRFVHEHVAAPAVVALARSRDAAVHRLAEAASVVEPSPTAMILFGSFARGDADAHSDIDVIVVRPGHVPDDDEAWARSLDDWRITARRIVGNRIDVLEVSEQEVGQRLRSDAPLWQDVIRDGISIHGLRPEELRIRARA